MKYIFGQSILIAVFFLICFVPQAKACSSISIVKKFPSAKGDTVHVAYEKYLPVVKKKLDEHLRKARLYSNLAFGMIPLNFVTFGLAYIAGLAFSIISIVEVNRIRKLQDQFSELEDDPETAAKIRNSYLRLSALLLLFLAFPILFLLLLSFIFSLSTFTGLVFFVALLALGLFFVLDWLVFRTGKFAA